MTHSELSNIQDALINYIIGKKSNIQQHIVDQGKFDSTTRLNIYHNAYHLRLRETIDTDHSVLGSFLGDDLFNLMVNGYITQHPSNFSSLRQYADALPRFLAETPPFSEHPVIAEMAHFERRLLTAFDAAQAQRLTSEQIQQMPQDRWPTLSFRFHPSFQLINTQWNTVEIWQALKKENDPPQAIKENTSWQLWRNRDRLTQFKSIGNEELVLMKMALSGATMEALCKQLLKAHDEQSAPQKMVNYLLLWIQQGVLSTSTTVK
ncbi:MAG: putative DNA-binding domain-containing protein [Spongiibacteraceae bacterium]|nr:putative DNA-binding domain-containing protein [Spongiibacteraceae bacterium]